MKTTAEQVIEAITHVVNTSNGRLCKMSESDSEQEPERMNKRSDSRGKVRK